MNNYKLICEIRSIDEENCVYIESDKKNIGFNAEKISSDNIKTVYKITLENKNTTDFTGVIHFKLITSLENTKFFMPGYMYNRNTADMPSSGRKAFPRIKTDGNVLPESPFFMTRSDRLAEPVSLIYADKTVLGLSASPCLTDKENGNFINHNGFSCNINDNGFVSAGYTLGYENAPWLFVQTATVLEREPITNKNAFTLKVQNIFSFELTVYDYKAEEERDIYRAVEDVYWQYHESPRKINGMNCKKTVSLLSSAIRDYAWLPDEHIYSGFVYDRPEGLAYNKIPSVTWPNGLSVAVPMLMAANKLKMNFAQKKSIKNNHSDVYVFYYDDDGYYEDGHYFKRGHLIEEPLTADVHPVRIDGVWSDSIDGSPAIYDYTYEHVIVFPTEYAFEKIFVKQFWSSVKGKDSEYGLSKNEYTRKKIAALLKRIDKSELRLMRNTIYAFYNFSFKSEDLQEIFSCIFNYCPDESVTVESIESKMTADNKKMLDMIIEEESRK